LAKRGRYSGQRRQDRGLPPFIFVKKNIAVFVHHPMCSIESVNGIMRALAPTYNIKIFTKHKVPDDFFEDVELVVFPGGVGDASAFGSLLKANLDDVKKILKPRWKISRYLHGCVLG